MCLLLKVLINYKSLKSLLQSNSETIANDKEIPTERDISPEERQKITDKLRLIL